MQSLYYYFFMTVDEHQEVSWTPEKKWAHWERLTKSELYVSDVLCVAPPPLRRRQNWAGSYRIYSMKGEVRFTEATMEQAGDMPLCEVWSVACVASVYADHR